jgi:DNA mismatch endonuclease (patch repair protein)
MAKGTTPRSRPSSSSEVASFRMRAVRQSETKPEARLGQELRRLGLRFAIDQRPIPTCSRRGDFVFKTARVVVLIDGCFWHCCPTHATWPKANSEWWKEKLEGNVRRDRDTDRRLRRAGWSVVRIWEHEDMAEAARRVSRKVALRLVSVR